MICLLLDSSDKNLTVGVARDGVILSSVSYEAWQKQSELMVGEVRSCLEKASLTPKQIGAVIVSKGPGSYTGIRIALSIGKTIAFLLQIPLYLASSLEIYRNGDKPSVCVMNARGKRSYFGVYQGKECLVEDCIKPNEEVLQYLDEHPDYVLCGDVSYLGKERHVPDLLGNLLECMDEKHKVEEVHAARPVYLKDDYGSGSFKIVVRKAMPSDIPFILEIERTSFSHPFAEKDVIYEMTENPVAHLYCATVDGVPVGYVDFYITFNSATIARIAVKEEFRSKGIGNRLIGQIIRDCESQVDPVEFLTLEVRASNTGAHRFYKRHKFEDITVKKGYYTDGEDAMYMVRHLVHG